MQFFFLFGKARKGWTMDTSGRERERKRVAWKFSNKLFLIDIFLFLWPFVFHSFSFVHRASKIREKFLSSSSSCFKEWEVSFNFIQWKSTDLRCRFSYIFPKYDWTSVRRIFLKGNTLNEMTVILRELSASTFSLQGVSHVKKLNQRSRFNFAIH